jgi:hypothetical protein
MQNKLKFLTTINAKNALITNQLNYYLFTCKRIIPKVSYKASIRTETETKPKNKEIYIVIIVIQLNSYLFTFKLNSVEDNYKVSKSKKNETTNHL